MWLAISPCTETASMIQAGKDRQEMFKVIDRLVSDISDMNNYISSIVAQVTILLPNKISKCTARQEEKLCAAFSDDLEDPDALLAEMEVTCGAMEKSEAKNLHEAEG